ncbi:MFS transporter [Dehalococcoidia bacterium]|nr:MFS transporter [Dehalococcoidia bacterium]
MILILTHSNFRLLWIAFTLTGLAWIMFMMVQGWLTLSLTGSPLWVGTITGIGGVGWMSSSIVGGVLADRYSRRKLVLTSNLILAGATAAIAPSILSESILLWQIATLSLIAGATSGMRMPAFMSMTLDVVGRERLLSANGAIYLGFGVGGMIAPLIAGTIASHWHIGIVYVCISTVSLVAPLILFKLPQQRDMPEFDSDLIRLPDHEDLWKAAKFAVGYARKAPIVRSLILLSFVSEVFGWSHNSMLPVIAKDVLGTKLSGLGYLQSAAMAGSILSTSVISNLKDIRHKERLMLVTAILFPMFLIIFSGTRTFPMALVTLAAAYAMGSAFDATLWTVLHSTIPNSLRGRISSFVAFTWGVNGLSGFHTGALANRFGAPWAIVIGAVTMITYTLRILPLATDISKASKRCGKHKPPIQ